MTQKDTSVYCWKKGRVSTKEKARHTIEVVLSVETRRGSITTITHRTPPTFESLSTLMVLTLGLGYFLCGSARRGEGNLQMCTWTPGGGTVINVQSSLGSPAAFSTKHAPKIGV